MEGQRAELHEFDIACDEGVEPLLDQAETERVAGLVLREEGVSRPCAVSITFVDDERIRKLNAEWRGMDRATDVISLECERPDDPDLAPGEPCELGDIVLAPAYITAQADRMGTTPTDEGRLLLIHGMLHLLGYDHLEDGEAEVMEAREDELLALAGAGAGHVALTRHRGDDV